MKKLQSRVGQRASKTVLGGTQLECCKKSQGRSAILNSPKYNVELYQPRLSREAKNGTKRIQIEIYLLEYNCFTMLGQFLLYKEVNQPYVYTYPISLASPFHCLIPPLQVTTEPWAEPPLLYSRPPLALSLTCGGAHMSTLNLSSFHPLLLHPPAMSTCPISTCVSAPAL